MTKNLLLPTDYQNLLTLEQTEKAIKLVKDTFQQNLASQLRLRRVTAPLFVLKGTGINDDLNGTERKVTFPIKDQNDVEAEVVNSLAKWKRIALSDYNIKSGYGIYTDMNAIRPDEELDNIHSLYVDQWDWELAISESQRNLNFLKDCVNKIYNALKCTEFVVQEYYPSITPILPNEITYIHSEDLLAQYPDLTPKERENKVAKKYGAVFIIGIGGELANGEPHDGRAPDYDDWNTPTTTGHKGLNGDIILWNPILKNAFEISSMGIRVDKNALNEQLKIAGAEDRKTLMFHKKLLNEQLPLSLGGGIGQSRLCMYFLRKAHIGETQTSIWPDEMVNACREKNIFIL